MLNYFQIPPCRAKFWAGHDSGTHKRTNDNTHTHTHTDRVNSICPSAISLQGHNSRRDKCPGVGYHISKQFSPENVRTLYFLKWLATATTPLMTFRRSHVAETYDRWFRDACVLMVHFNFDFRILIKLL